MIDFTIVFSIILALMLIRIVDDAVEYINYRLTKKKRDKAFAEFLDRLEENNKAARRASIKKKAAPKRK